MRSTRNFRLILQSILIQKIFALYHWDGKECQEIFDKEKVIRGSKTHLNMLIEISKHPVFENAQLFSNNAYYFLQNPETAESLPSLNVEISIGNHLSGECRLFV